MSKQIFPKPPDVLGNVTTYEEFIDILTDAWLEAESTEGVIPDPRFRRGLFYLLDKKVNERTKKP